MIRIDVMVIYSGAGTLYGFTLNIVKYIIDRRHDKKKKYSTDDRSSDDPLIF